MRTRNDPRLLLVSLAGLVLSGCASSTAPSGWLPGPEDAVRGTRGAWVTVKRLKPLEPRRIHGELLGVGDSALVVLPYRGRSEPGEEPFMQWESTSTLVPAAPTAIPYGEIEEVKVTFYDSREGGMAAWSVLGTVSTLSHGVGLILSAPTWMIVGGVSTADVSREPEVKAKTRATIWDLRKFARFPQGIPAGVAITALDRDR